MLSTTHTRDLRVSPKNNPSYTRPPCSSHSFSNLWAAELHEPLDTDLDDIDGWSEESEDIEVYKGTKPLRVKKKKINFTAGRVVTSKPSLFHLNLSSLTHKLNLCSDLRHRRSAISGPRSPRSPRSLTFASPKSPKSPALKRNPSAATSASAHAHISQLFFALPHISFTYYARPIPFCFYFGRQTLFRITSPSRPWQVYELRPYLSWSLTACFPCTVTYHAHLFKRPRAQSPLFIIGMHIRA